MRDDQRKQMDELEERAKEIAAAEEEDWLSDEILAFEAQLEAKLKGTGDN